MNANRLIRFLDAQNQSYFTALAEIKAGRKTTHWMWFIFPQIKGLGQSETSKYYAIHDLQEATEYLNHPVLGKHLIEISEVLLTIEGKSAREILGTPDDIKLQSSMTLFANVPDAGPVFNKVIAIYFDGVYDARTMGLIGKNDP
jgi:uncharacterized protein (DUF1810 family)